MVELVSNVQEVPGFRVLENGLRLKTPHVADKPKCLSLSFGVK